MTDSNQQIEPTVPSRRNQRGVVLALVMIIGLILSTSILTFVRRSIVDAMIVRNRDRVAEAEALARSGIEIAKLVLVEQIHRKIDTASGRGLGEELVGNTKEDLWAKIGDYQITTPEGAVLRIDIFDNRSRINLNSLVAYGTTNPLIIAKVTGKPKNIGQANELYRRFKLKRSGRKVEPLESYDPKREGKPVKYAVEFLIDFFDRVIENMDVSPEQKDYDTRELAENLLDYIDEDSTRMTGNDEDDWYQSQTPAYYPANGPLLSTLELGLVEGFDSVLVEALQPYVTVYPLLRGRGVNINTAPPHVLGCVYHGGGGDKRLLDEDDVGQILGIRDEGLFICDKTEVDPDRCLSLGEVNLEGPIFPVTELPSVSFVYTILSEVVYDDVERSLEVVINMSSPNEPRLLFWRMQ